MSTPRTALLIVDVQNDFCEGGALGVDGGTAVAHGVTRWVREQAGAYALVLASRDWHRAEGDNGGHFASGEPDFRTTWPVHCVEGTPGADYHPALELPVGTVHVRKGQGVPAYSAFEGATEDGRSPAEVLSADGVEAVDVVGIATDHCVRATVLDALRLGLAVRVLSDLVAGVAEESSAAALAEMTAAGATVAPAGSEQERTS